MWSKLRARHYTLILLLAVVSLQTSAIAIDRFLSRSEDTAFAIEGNFRNNPFMERFQLAEANAAPLPQIITVNRQTQQISRVSFDKQNLASIANPTVDASLHAKTSNSAAADIAQLSAVQDWLDYTVKKGDSLAQIAALFGIKSSELASANGLSENKNLKAGEKLRIPLSSARLVYTVKPGDSLSKVANRFGITIQDLISENNLKTYSLAEGQKLTIPVHNQKASLTIVSSNSKIENPIQIIRESSLSNSDRSNIALVPSPNKLQIVQTTSINDSLKIVRLPASNDKLANDKLVQVSSSIQKQAIDQSLSKNSKQLSVHPMAAPSSAIKSIPEKISSVELDRSTALSNTRPNIDNEIKFITYTVKNGDTLPKIAREHNSSISQIISHNSLINSNLKPGQQLKVPVSQKFYRVTQVTSRKTPAKLRLQMPVASGHLTDRYGWRYHPVWRKRLFHAGIDLSAPTGTPICAALPGQVVYAGWRSGYGKLIIIRHANGLSTRYGHCSSFNVRAGQMVKAGQVIGRVGSTGVTTGPHLHFEVRRNGKTLNPQTLLAL